MTTALLDAIGADIATKETPLEELSDPPAGIELDVLRLHHGNWELTGGTSNYTVVYPMSSGEPNDCAGEILYPQLFGEHTLASQLRRLHREFTPLTQGTVVTHQLQVITYDAPERIFAARARAENDRRYSQLCRGRVRPARAWETFEELAGWIGIGKVKTARVLGISRGTTNAWKAGGEPQPANARRLYRTHAVVKTLTRRLGIEETRNWLETGDPSPLDRLSAADFNGFAHVASLLVFDGGVQAGERVGAFIDEPVIEPPSQAESVEIEGVGAADPRRRLQRRAPRRRAQ